MGEDYLKFYPEEETLLPIATKVLSILQDNQLNYSQCDELLMLVRRELSRCRFVLNNVEH